MNRKSLKWIVLAAVLIVVGFFAYRYWRASQTALPKGIYSGNGRLQAKLVDVTAKEPLRVKKIFVDEGALVQRGQVVVQLDTSTLDAELQTAKANVVAKQGKETTVKATIQKCKSDLELAKIERQRAQNLLKERAGSQRAYDVRVAAVKSASAALEEAQSQLKTAKDEVAVAKSNVDTVQTRIDDATLRSPVRGRVLYRLAEQGEVLAAGGKALTLVNLQDIYMGIFLPAEQAAQLKIGAQARITLDFAPGRAIPGYVSFVSPEAQFTPKQVETPSEREKLMFRVKIQVPEQLVEPYIQNIKTGVRGVGYVKADPAAVWPKRLQNLLGSPKQQTGTAPTTQRSGSATQTQPAPTQPQSRPGNQAGDQRAVPQRQG